MDRPKIIYKFEAFTAQSLQNLKAQSLYFGSPLGFNDPYDCAIRAAIEEPTDSELEELKEAYAQKPGISDKLRRQFETTDIKQLKEMVIRSAQ